MTSQVTSPDGPQSTEREQNRRGLWVVSDQAINSLFNLVVGLVAVQSLSPSGFGIFAVYFASYLIIRGIFRALLLEPVLILYPSQDAYGHRSIIHGAALAVGFFAGLATLAVNAALGNAVEPVVALGFAVAVGPLLWADAERVISAAVGRPERGALLGITMLTLLVAAAFLASDATSSVGRIFLLIGACTTVGIALAKGLSFPALDPRRIIAWLRKHIDIGAPLVGEYLASAGLAYVALVLLASVSVDEAGAFRAAQMLVAPVHMLFLALSQHLVVEGSRLNQAGRPMARLVKMVAGVMALAGLGAAGTIVIAGRQLTDLLLAETAMAALPVVAPLAIHAAISAVAAVGSSVLRAQNRSKQVVKLRFASAIPESLAIVIGAIVAGAQGVATAGVFALLVALPLWYRPIKEILNRRGETGETVVTDASSVEH